MEEWQRDAAALAADSREKLVIDLRDAAFFHKGSWPGAQNIFWEDFQNDPPALPKDRPIYLICYTGQTAEEYAEEYRHQGYEIFSVEDGWHGCLRFLLEQQMNNRN